MQMTAMNAPFSFLPRSLFSSSLLFSCARCIAPKSLAAQYPLFTLLARLLALASRMPPMRLSFLACACAVLLSVSSVAAWQPARSLASALALLQLGSEPAALLADAPFPCSFTAPDGTYWDYSPLTTTTGTVFTGVRPPLLPPHWTQP